ncbi:MAG: sigma-70 family RNA polymerase sigma factor [Acidimicrobiales bacterium]
MLWRRFFATRAVPERNSLVLHYGPLVKYVTSRMAAAYPSHADLEDLMAAGLDGLFSAIERAVPDRIKTFESYACNLIRYAVLEELRSLDHASRSERHDLKRLKEADESLTYRLGRTPTHRDIADELGWSLGEVEDVMGRALAVRTDSLDLKATPSEWIFDQGPTPEETQIASAEAVGLWSAVDHLPAQHRQVVEMFYRFHLHQSEIAPRLGITPGRVSQIHSQAIAELRHVLAGLDGSKMAFFPSPDDLLQ